MGSHDITFTWTQRKKMKYQLFLVAILGAACFAAPVSEFDPDCVDDDFSIEEPLVAEPAVGIPDLVWNFEEEAASDDCVDDIVTAAPVVATEECEDPLPETAAPTAAPVANTEECEDPIEPTEPAPIVVTEEACEDPIVTQAPVVVTDADCVTDGVENQPALDFHIEKAEIEEAEPVFVFADEHELPALEECDEY